MRRHLARGTACSDEHAPRHRPCPGEAAIFASGKRRSIASRRGESRRTRLAIATEPWRVHRPRRDASPPCNRLQPSRQTNPHRPADAEVGAHATGHATPLSACVVGALGVVFGDIGTSPLYAIKECVDGSHGVPPTHENVLGVLSLVFWSLTMVVTVKYLTFIMRADNTARAASSRCSRSCRAKKVQSRHAHRVDCRRSSSSARRCSTATASSRRPSRCSAPSRAWTWRRTALEAGHRPAHLRHSASALFLVQAQGPPASGASSGR